MKYLLLCFVLVAASGCTSAPLRSRTATVNPGDTREVVTTKMGTPEDRQFREKLEAWQYCSTGMFKDDFVVVWFKEGIVTGSSAYTKDNSALSCTSNFGQVRWDAAPTATLEIRER